MHNCRERAAAKALFEGLDLSDLLFVIGRLGVPKECLTDSLALELYAKNLDSLAYSKNSTSDAYLGFSANTGPRDQAASPGQMASVSKH
jgi:hypothetical protein